MFSLTIYLQNDYFFAGMTSAIWSCKHVRAPNKREFDFFSRNAVELQVKPMRAVWRNRIFHTEQLGNALWVLNNSLHPRVKQYQDTTYKFIIVD